ncbi:MAG TPA: hypothetical protein PKC89_11925 [Pyrinomonadaceae bacterium]|nr:hypothetical protein [Pyrinomonadaceae bacterium]
MTQNAQTECIKVHDLHDLAVAKTRAAGRRRPRMHDLSEPVAAATLFRNGTGKEPRMHEYNECEPSASVGGQ